MEDPGLRRNLGHEYHLPEKGPKWPYAVIALGLIALFLFVFMTTCQRKDKSVIVNPALTNNQPTVYIKPTNPSIIRIKVPLTKRKREVSRTCEPGEYIPETRDYCGADISSSFTISLSSAKCRQQINGEWRACE